MAGWLRGVESGKVSSCPKELSYLTAHEDFKIECERLIVRHGLHAVCEIGGGRWPLFEAADALRLGFDYVVSDVSIAELELTPPEYKRLRIDVSEAPPTHLRGQFDFVFSKMVAEHVRDGGAMHRNILEMLKGGGFAFHFFPTLYYPAFVVNRIIPEAVSRSMKRWLQHGDLKFQAYYSRCVGPTRDMREFLQSTGYDIIQFRPFYGTAYLDGVPVLRAVEREFSAWAARRQNPHLTSYTYLVLRKRPAAERRPLPSPATSS